MGISVIDLTGKRFGILTVIKRVYPNSKSGYPRWLCKCDCGIEKILCGCTLRRGHTKSCGCLRRLRPGLSGMRGLISCYKLIAKKKGREYTLTEEQFEEITKKKCHYCGTKPRQIYDTISNSGKYVHNGIDRIDNLKGYTIDNVVPCCKFCNAAKNIRTLPEFKDWVKRIYNHMYNKKEVK